MYVRATCRVISFWLFFDGGPFWIIWTAPLDGGYTSSTTGFARGGGGGLCTAAAMLDAGGSSVVEVVLHKPRCQVLAVALAGGARLLSAGA